MYLATRQSAQAQASNAKPKEEYQVINISKLHDQPGNIARLLNDQAQQGWIVKAATPFEIILAK